MKTRRAGKKTFSALIDREKAEAIERKLKEEGKTKTAWLEEQIARETKNNDNPALRKPEVTVIAPDKVSDKSIISDTFWNVNPF